MESIAHDRRPSLNEDSCGNLFLILIHSQHEQNLVFINFDIHVFTIISILNLQFKKNDSG